VLVVSSVWGLALGVATAVLSTAAFDFFHVPPNLDFVPHDPQGPAALVILLSVALAIDDGFVSALKDGRARIVGRVERLEREGAILIGGDRSPADDVICATGYRRGLEQLVGHLGALDERGAPRCADGVPADPETPGLYFAGFRVALSGSIRIAGKHSCRIAEAIASEAPRFGR
jgi:hypothetical protein